MVYCKSKILIVDSKWCMSSYTIDHYSNMLGVHVFFAMIVAHFEVFLIKQLFHSHLLDMR